MRRRSNTVAKRFRILVVDDESVNIKVITDALSEEYDIISALNGFDAITLLREHAPDLILLDVLMPEISGFDVCTMIKSEEAFADIPVIFLTAFDTEEGELRGLVLGGIDYLTKPINYDLLRQRIRNHVALKAKNDLMKLQVDQLARQKEELAQMVAEQKQLNKLLLESDATLKERMKELNCLYFVSSIVESPDLSLEEICKMTVTAIPPAWQFPDITEARIEFEEHSCQTERFRETPWMLVSDISVHGTSIGHVKVCYLEERQASDEGPFLIQERYLLNAIAEKLGQKNARYLDEKVRKVITDSVNEAIIMMNPQGEISFWNPAASRLWGYLPDEVLGKNLHNLLVPERYRDAYNSAHPEFLRTGHVNAIGKTLELFALHKDGREIAVELSQAAVFMDGEWHSVGIVRDITEQKSVMAQLIHSQKMETIGQLAGGLAHDLNNILCVVNGYTALAQFEIDKDHKVFNYLGEITLASSRAASLTRSLLAYSRKQEMIQQRQNLNQLIETVGSFINRIIRDNIIFTLSLQADPLGVNVDVVQMEQVLLNLASNARDAMPDGGVFNIATSTGCIDAQFIASHGYGELQP